MSVWGIARSQDLQKQWHFSKWSQSPGQDCSSGTVNDHILKLTMAHQLLTEQELICPEAPEICNLLFPNRSYSFVK